MPESILGSIAGPVLGGLFGSEGSSSTQTSQNQIDPRMAKYIYGDGNTQGLLGSAYDWYSKNKSGLNDQMTQGMNSQWNVLTDPSTMAGYKQTSALGSGLMSAPVMGNPFSDGRVSLMGGGSSNLGMGSASSGREQKQPVATQPQSYNLSSYLPTSQGSTTNTSGPFSAAAPTPAPAPSTAPATDPAGLSQLWQNVNMGFVPVGALDNYASKNGMTLEQMNDALGLPYGALRTRMATIIPAG